MRQSISVERGQSLLLALIIMFLLVFIGGVFVALISRNLSAAKRSGQSMTADYLAEAGIAYANDQLTYGEDGADWRPAPQYPEVVRALSNGTNPEALDAAYKPITNDPDRFWLMQGYSRFTYGKGRFLLRVTYNPSQTDPLGKHIKIESIGRVGLVEPNDPTTLDTRQPLRQRKEKVAYKAVPLASYARYVTNKDRQSGDMSLGTPGFITQFGKNTAEGAPIRVNGDLLWHGTDFVWLNTARGDQVEVAGDIKHAAKQPADNGIDTRVYVNGAWTYQSSDVDGAGDILFDTAPGEPALEVGFYRDGRPGADRPGRPRQVDWVEAPLLDAPDYGVSRYRDLTRNSGEWQQDANLNWYNTGYYGWGNGLYIDNRQDVQDETMLYTLRGNWTEPGGRYWTGPYYTPPGVSILLTPYDLDNKDLDDNIYTGPDMVIVHDAQSGQTEFNWFGPDGKLMAGDGERVIMPYPENGVIFAEGNIRVKGTLPPGIDEDGNARQITIVSGGTIYIEGSILKCPFKANGASFQPGEAPTSAAALLATDYVCVNTTQFFGPSREVLMSANEGGYFDIGTDRSFWLSFAFGVDVSDYVDTDGTTPMPVKLYLKHTSDPDEGPSYINMLINYPPTDAELATDQFYSLYHFDPNDTYNYALADTLRKPTEAAWQKYPRWEHAVFSLPTDSNNVGPNGAHYRFYPERGVYNTIGFQLDQTFGTSTGLGLQDYYLARAAVQPCDIRIEAMLYAQNGSFFVIPGEWFNDDPTDVRTAATRPDGVDPEWPFYGEPLDVEITVYGAVSENVPASVGDVSAWMEKWGWIPQEHGSSGKYTVGYRSALDPNLADPNDLGYPQQGLTFVYDGGLLGALRHDEYNRILPVTPKLPVSRQMLYFGEPT
ncbi:MAG: hypothetical protein ACYC2Y_03155 [Armatimonadota bacterium]